MADADGPFVVKRHRSKTHIAPQWKSQSKTSAPTNNFVTPLLNDLYQITMAYSYWQQGRQDLHAVFDLYFRKNPFGGEITMFAGLDEVVRSRLDHFDATIFN